MQMKDSKPHYENKYKIPGAKLCLYMFNKATDRKFIDFIKPILIDINRIDGESVGDSDLIELISKLDSIRNLMKSNDCGLPEPEHRMLFRELNNLIQSACAYLYMDKSVCGNAENRASFINAVKQGFQEIGLA